MIGQLGLQQAMYSLKKAGDTSQIVGEGWYEQLSEDFICIQRI